MLYSSEVASIYDITEEDLKANRIKAEQEVSNLSVEEYYNYRKLAKKDLFFLCYSVLGYDKLGRLHNDVCNWMRETQHQQYRELLLPRSHYKTTIWTIGDGIQTVLPDDSNDAVGSRALGTNGRVLLVHEVHESAMLFLAEISAHFLTNPILMGLFPECVPDLKKHRVNRSQLELPRTKHWKEPTFSTLGVGGRAQGQHFNKIKADDIIGDKARDSKTEMEAAKLWVDNIQALLVTPKEDEIDFAGTRWSYDDVYAHIHKKYEDNIVKYIRGVEEYNLQTKKKELIFPEQFTQKSIAILRKNPKVFSAQYANDPRESANVFNSEWKKFYRLDIARRNTLFYHDAVRDDEVTVDIYQDLDRVILIDPAVNGLAGFIVTGVDKKHNVFVLEATKEAWQPEELIEKIFTSVMRWQPRLVAIEDVLFSVLFQNIIIREQARRGIRFQVVGLKTKQKAKEVRVYALNPYFAAGQIYFHAGMNDLIEEFDMFGATSDYHMLDALAHGPQVWKPATNMKLLGSGQDYANEVLDQRDSVTGYSPLWDDD